jgi:hypothetical protein
MKNISTGTGLCVLGLCLASYPIIDRVMPRAEAGATHVAAVVAAATAQVPPEPTIVWYGISSPSIGQSSGRSPMLLRAWSDGKVEGKVFDFSYPCLLVAPCGWQMISEPNSGYNAASDINFDAKVDGADLGQLLADWGDAPRHDIPPSDCPLNLINP